MTLRTLSSNSTKQAEIENSLKNYDPFIVAHLIKFEQPAPMGNAEVRGASNYTYITDSSYDIAYNDGSLSPTGVSNGEQTYRANKIISIGTVNENIIAKAANLTLKLDSSSLGMSVNALASLTKHTGTDGTLATNTDLSSLGFQEGDTISAQVGSQDLTLTLGKFSNEGKTVKVTTSASAYSTTNTTIKQNTAALNALLVEKTQASDYAGYINRDVFIYKCHINPETRQIIGDPFLYFKGIISTGSLIEKLESSEVTWGLTSHWGDFLQVKGRISDDASHRALNSIGQSDEDALIKSAYKGDFGFLHSNTAILQAIKYTATEQEQYYRGDQSFWGAGTGSMQTRDIEVERTTTLDFNLKAKQIPVVYGVRKIKSFPVFVDTVNSDMTQVYKAEVLCEGSIASMYDILVEGNSITCSDNIEFESRGNGQYGDKPPEQVCFGNKARGDVIKKGQTVSNSQVCIHPNEVGNVSEGRWVQLMRQYKTCVEQMDLTSASSSPYDELAVGLQHDDRYILPSPTPIYTDLVFHTGLPNQKTDARFSAVANGLSYNRFTLQNKYFDTSLGVPYWSSSHRLLDTCYVSTRYQIGDGATTIPNLEYIIKGKNVECHNYDDSFARRKTQSDSDASHFDLGDTVDIYVLPGDGLGTANINTDTRILQNVTVIDKFSSLEPETTQSRLTTRFRWSSKPSSNTTDYPAAHSFYMTVVKDGVRYYWYMSKSTSPLLSGSPGAAVSSGVTTTYNQAGTVTGTRKIQITAGGETLNAFYLNDDVAILALYSGTLNGSDVQKGPLHSYAGNSTINLLDNLSISSTDSYDKAKLVNAIRFPNTASSVDEAYLGMSVTYTRYVDLGRYGTHAISDTQKILKYDGSARVAFVEEAWDTGFVYPGEDPGNESFSLGTAGDLRPTINPAMQLLDYLTDVRYGKGLSISKDIDIESFKEAARACDTRSDVSIVFPVSGVPSLNQTLEYPKQADQSATNKIQWQGTVSSVSSTYTINGTQYKLVTFTDCVGKLGTKWNNYTKLLNNQLFWNDGSLYIKSVTGVVTNIATLSSSALSSIQLGLLGSSTTFTPNISLSSANGNPIVKGYSSTNNTFTASGYTLYDSDDVKYWRYTGWDEPTQRNVTRHQMNQIIDTGIPVFDNVNKMLDQFNGVLQYSGGKYNLTVKGKKGSVDPDFEVITEDDIIGAIKITDGGLKNSKNYMSAAIIDPQNGFESRNVSFFNSTYLKQDKGLQKKGQTRLSGITNYFNARMNVEQRLNESRFSQGIQFTMSPKGLLLTAGSIIELTYPRFGYTSKEFRISNLNFKKDGTVDVSALEHSDTIYDVSEPSLPDIAVGERDNPRLEETPAAPTDLVVTSNILANAGQIALQWKNTANWNSETHVTEIYRSTDASFSSTLTAGSFVPGTFYVIKNPGNTDFTDIGSPDNNVNTIFLATGAGTGSGTASKAVLAGTSTTNYFVDEVRTGTGQQTRYYWIRYRVRKPAFNVSGSAFRAIFSLYEPLSSANGVSGYAYPVNVIRAVQISPSGKTFIYESDGTGIESGGTTSSLSTSLINSTGGTVTYAWTIDGSAAAGTSNTSAYTYTAPNAQSSMPQIVKCTVTEVVNGETFTFEDTVVMTGTTAGAGGDPGARGPGRWNIDVDSVNYATSTATGALPADGTDAAEAWNEGAGDQPDDEVAGDQAFFYKGTEASPTAQKVFIYNGSAWNVQTEILDGDLLIDNSVDTAQIADDAVTGTQIDSETTILAGPSGAEKVGLDGTGTGNDIVRIFAGDTLANKTSAPFQVTHSGALTASSANISGTVTADTFVINAGATLANVEASSLENDTVTIASLSPEVINYIDEIASSYTSGSPGDYETTNFNVSNSTSVPSTLHTFSNFDHGSNNPRVSLWATSFMYLPTYYTGNNLLAQFKLYYKKSSDSTWTVLDTVDVTATSTVIPQNPAFTRYLHTYTFHHEATHTIAANESNIDFDYKVDLTDAPGFADNNIYHQFSVNESGSSTDVDATTLDTLDSLQFMRSDTNTEAAAYIRHKDDSDTYMYFEDDKISFAAGGATMITMEEAVNDTITLHQPVIANSSVSSDLFKSETYGSNSFLDFENDKGYVGANGVSLVSVSNMDFIADSNNNQTDDTFTWGLNSNYARAINGTLETNYKRVMSLAEAGLTILPDSTTGYLRGPATFTIDPATHADNTGTVIIAGNLQVDGIQTTINSTTLDIDDLNITLAKGSTNAAAANGAGITVDVGTTDNPAIANPEFKYTSSDDSWFSTKDIRISTGTGTGTFQVGRDATNQFIQMHVNDADNTILAKQDSDENGNHSFDLTREFAGTGESDFRVLNGTTPQLIINKQGKVALGPGSIATDSENRVHITDSLDTEARTSHNSIFLDYNISGNDLQSTSPAIDTNHRGIFLDIDSSATGGDTSNEHRIYGIDVDLDVNGDSDLVYGIKVAAEAQPSSGQISALYGMYAVAVNDVTGDAKVVNTYGGWFQAQNNSSGTNTGDQNLVGVYARAVSSNASDGLGQNDITGLFAEVEIDDPGQAETFDNAYVIRAFYDNDDATNNHVDMANTYLFHGQYADNTTPANANNSYGMHLSTNVNNHLQGALGVGIAPTGNTWAYKLDVLGEADKSAARIRNNTDNSTDWYTNPQATLELGNSNTTADTSAVIKFKKILGRIVYGDGSGTANDKLIISPRLSEDSTTLSATFDSQGRLGLGTEAPTHRLEIAQAMASGPSHIFYKMLGTNTIGGGAGIKFKSSATDTSTNKYWSGMQGVRTTSDDGSNELRFWTASASINSGVPSQRMVISELGKVGIGVAVPNKNLHISYNSDTTALNDTLGGATAGVGALIQNVNTTAGVYANLDFRAGTADARISYKFNSEDNGDFHFITANAGSPATKMVILDGGNVGVGYDNPGRKLEVNGSIGVNDTGRVYLRSTLNTFYISDDLWTSSTATFATMKMENKSSTITLSPGSQGTSVDVLVLHAGSGTTFKGIYNIDTDELADISTTNAVTVDEFLSTVYRSARYSVQITQGSNYQMSELLVIHNGTTAYATEYGMIETNGILGTFEVSISSSNLVQLKCALLSSTTNATVKVVRHSIVV